MQCFILLST